jgi:hypothetical protein
MVSVIGYRGALIFDGTKPDSTLLNGARIPKKQTPKASTRSIRVARICVVEHIVNLYARSTLKPYNSHTLVGTVFFIV